MKRIKSKSTWSYVCSLLVVLLLLTSSNTQIQQAVTDGVVPNRDFSQSEEGKIISPQMGERHLNQPIVFNGYAILCGNAEHEIWDISNPYDPKLKKVFTSKHNSGEAESHQASMHRTVDGKYFLATISGRGIDIWDMTNTLNPVYVNDIVLPGVNYGDVDNGVWGVSWQGDYIFAGSTNHGLRIIDVSDMQNPELVKTITRAQLGNIKPGPLFAMGDILVITTPKQNGGIATVNITDPRNPIVLDTDREGSSYIGGFYGKHAVLINPVRFYDVTTDPSNIKKVASINTDRAEYVAFDNGELFLGGLRGGSHGIHIYDITNLPNMPKRIRVRGRDTRWDDQFACPVGNLVVIADDQRVGGKYVGGIIAVHNDKKDEVGPKVIDHFPKKDETNVDLRSGVGFSMSDWIEFKSVDANSIVVRPLGGQPLRGSASWLYTTLNFIPEEPLKNNTVYEVILPTNGITDLVGNDLEEEFKFLFSTGETVDVTPIESPIISGNEPVKLSQNVNWSIDNPSEDATYLWTVDGNDLGTGTSYTTSFNELGRYETCLKVYRKGSGSSNSDVYEAENANIGGNVQFATNQAGFTGSGFMDFPAEQNNGTYLEWVVQSDEALTVPIKIRYATGSGVRSLNLSVNNGNPVKVDFPSGGGWTAYREVTIDAQQMVQGNNTIRLTANAGTPGPNIDHLKVEIPSSNLGSLVETKCFVQVVYNTTENKPSSSSTIIKKGDAIWNVNPDAGTVSKISTATKSKIKETRVGDFPKALASVNNEVWVVNRDSYSISILSDNGDLTRTITLPYASQPVALVVSPDEQFVFVSLSVIGEVLKLNAVSGLIEDRLVLRNSFETPELGGIAINGNGDRLFVSRFISKGMQGGEVYEINPNSMSLLNTITLKSTVTTDASDGSRGIPNYLTSLTINPNGLELWVPSKKDNLERGGLRDGNELNEVNTVRAVTSRITLANSREELDHRIDIDNMDRCHSVTFSDKGDLAFITLPGNELVGVIDANNGEKLGEFKVGKVPDGAVLDEVNKVLYVHNFLSRSVSSIDVSAILDGSGLFEPISEIAVVANEPLNPVVLKGKRIFYDASSKTLNKSGYMSCASCHLDGGHDGQTWDFTSLDEGLRNTIDLRGRAGTAHGRLHWTANFNEIHDFENQIRFLGAGDGLMTDGDFAKTEDPFGENKAGLSTDLDALSAYVTSLTKVPNSPKRNEDGSLTILGEKGKAIFLRENCSSCHSGNKFTDSPGGLLHDIGSKKPSSGSRIGEVITGFDTPTLKGIWNTAPYLHDGSAKTLDEAVRAHTKMGYNISDTEMNELVAYLEQIDELEAPTALPNDCQGVAGGTAYLDDCGVCVGGQSGKTACRPVLDFVKPVISGDLLEGHDLGVEVVVTDASVAPAIVSIHLYINEVLVRREGQAPYQWGTANDDKDDLLLLNLEVGEHTLKAIATDASGNTYESLMTFKVVEEQITSLESVLPLLEVYPNPSINGVFYLDKEYNYDVCDARGNKLFDGYGSMINLVFYPEGIYFLRVGDRQIKLLR